MTENQKPKIDWLLIIFLLLFTNQAIFSLKILGLVMICLARFNWRFGFGEGRLPKFYLYIMVLAVFNFLFITREFTGEYIAAFIIGNLFWIFSAISSHQMKLSMERSGVATVAATMKVFTAINFAFCIMQLVNVILITGRLNPYDPSIPFPYGVSTGDFIFGSFMEVSYYNTMVSALLAIYFIFKRSVLFTVLNVISFVLVFGNFGTIIFVGIITGLLLTGFLAALIKNTTGALATWIKNISPPGKFYLYLPGLFLFIGVMYYITSPTNYDYIVSKVKDKVFSVKSSDENNYATMTDNQKPEAQAFETSGEYFKEKEKARMTRAAKVKGGSLDNDFTDKKVDAKIELTKLYFEKLQGKNLSMLETVSFARSSTANLLFGAGTTRFSSLTAQKMSGFDSSRLFMNILPQYKSEPFADNHYLLLLERNKTSDYALLSTANRPDSLYNQLLGEYGLIGIALFGLFYIGFFMKKIRNWSYGFWLIAILLPFAHLNYVFDTLCVIPFFEYLMFEDISRNDKMAASVHES